MNPLNRREFLTTVLASTAVAGAGLRVDAAETRPPGMTISLSPGAIGVSGNQREVIDLAHRFGFEAVEPSAGYLAGLSDGERSELLGELKAKGLVWGSAGLPVDFRGQEERFRNDLQRLPRMAEGLQKCGATRVGTWLSPAHGRLTYLENFKQHSARLREACRILKDHGCRLGLEYVGTQTLRNRQKYPFIHTMAETLELIDSIGTGNVGLVMDSWHWWTAGDTVEDIRQLRAEQVVAGDLNDAPKGIPKEEQRDNQRELPAATGVIDLAGFLGALKAIGFDGPMRAEPFNAKLNAMNNEEACALTAAAMKKAFALIRG